MAKGDPVTSPYVWEDRDNEGDIIRITVTFNTSTRAITGITVFRDANCAYTRLFIGTGAGGNPNTTDKTVTVPAGTTVLSGAQLNQLANRGVGTIEEFLGLQITAAPPA